MIFRMLFDNIFFFLLVAVIFQLAFSVAFYTVYMPPLRSALTSSDWAATPEPDPNQQYSSNTSYRTFAETFDSLYRLFTFGNIDYGTFSQTYEDQHVVMPYLLYYLYTILASILLLNLLIAMMNDTYSSIKDKTELQWKLQRASIILEIERGFSFFKRRRPMSHEFEAATGTWWLLMETKSPITLDHFAPAAEPDPSKPSYRMLNDAARDSSAKCSPAWRRAIGGTVDRIPAPQSSLGETSCT